MRAAVRIAGLGVALSLGSLLVSESAGAARKAITGKLSARGYTLLALAADGRASALAARGGRFRLKPRAGSVTMHLRGPDGVYAGPVVIR